MKITSDMKTTTTKPKPFHQGDLVGLKDGDSLVVLVSENQKKPDAFTGTVIHHDRQMGGQHSASWSAAAFRPLPSGSVVTLAVTE